MIDAIGPGSRASAPARGQRTPLSVALGLGIITLVGVVAASVFFGSNPVQPAAIWDALWHADTAEASSIVWASRVPRTVAGVVVGIAFGVAGALIQAVSRNPLADPGILGVNAGAGLAVTIGIGMTGIAGISGYVWFAFVGAIVATLLVYLISSAGRGSAEPAQLILTGVALSAVFSGVSSFLSLLSPNRFQAVRTWSIGSIANIDWANLAAVVPFLAVGLVLALFTAGSLNAVALGDDLAASLGTNITRTRVLAVVSVTLLAGGATALTGGIAFVGLMVPHIVRWFVGPDQRRILGYTMLFAPILVLGADVVGRLVAYPGEIAVGIVSAVIGAPVLIALVRRTRVSGL